MMKDLILVAIFFLIFFFFFLLLFNFKAAGSLSFTKQTTKKKT